MMKASQTQFVYELLGSQEAVRTAIQTCEGSHVQQVVYSTFMDALTQVCFTEQRIRSTIMWAGSRSWVPGESRAPAERVTP